MLTSIYKRKDRPGVTLAYEDPRTGRVRQKQFRTRALAVARRDELRSAARRSAPGAAPPPEPDILFKDYAAGWLRATKTAVRVGTYRHYESALRVHLEPAFATRRLCDITQPMVRELVIALRERGLKKKTVRNVHGTLHGILEAAVEEGTLAANPAHIRSKSKLMRLATTPGEHRANVKALTVDQARAFFDAAPLAVTPSHLMLFRTMVSTGLRPGEAVALMPEDLDYTARTIRLERAISRGRVEACKTAAPGEFAVIDMPRGLADELKAWEAKLAAEVLRTGEPRSEWLFPGRFGGHLDETKRLRTAFKRILKKAGLPLHFSPHSLRHTYATHQLLRGVSIYYVQRQLRHADIQMTVGRYGSWLPATNRGAADAHFEALFGGGHNEGHNSQSARSE